jgi:hypothetical protein
VAGFYTSRQDKGSIRICGVSGITGMKGGGIPACSTARSAKLSDPRCDHPTDPYALLHKKLFHE